MFEVVGLAILIRKLNKDTYICGIDDQITQAFWGSVFALRYIRVLLPMATTACRIQLHFVGFALFRRGIAMPRLAIALVVLESQHTDSNQIQIYAVNLLASCFLTKSSIVIHTNLPRRRLASFFREFRTMDDSNQFSLLDTKISNKCRRTCLCPQNFIIVYDL